LSDNSLSENPSRLSENGLESTLLPMLFSLEREYPRLSENLFSLGRKTYHLTENQPESNPFFNIELAQASYSSLRLGEWIFSAYFA